MAGIYHFILVEMVNPSHLYTCKIMLINKYINIFLVYIYIFKYFPSETSQSIMV